MHNFFDGGLESEAAAARMKPFGVFTGPLERTTLPSVKSVLAAAVIPIQVMKNCVGVCMFLPYVLSDFRRIVEAVSGWDVTDLELFRVGERALAMARLYNAREGLTPADDAQPPRFAEPLLADGEERASIPEEEMREAVDLYCELEGWDKKTGAPTRTRLLELSLGWAVDALRPRPRGRPKASP